MHVTVTFANINTVLTLKYNRISHINVQYIEVFITTAATKKGKNNRNINDNKSDAKQHTNE